MLFVTTVITKEEQNQVNEVFETVEQSAANIFVSSDTTLVVFPAHNEERSVIKRANQSCPELFMLDWKAEVDALIESGIDRWSFCINDEHKHSTELAGLVGAHMIYRAIYGEIPSVDGIYAVNDYNARELLGTYLTDGKVSYNYEVLYV